jgi:hypothetical protein
VRQKLPHGNIPVNLIEFDSKDIAQSILKVKLPLLDQLQDRYRHKNFSGGRTCEFRFQCIWDLICVVCKPGSTLEQNAISLNGIDISPETAANYFLNTHKLSF